MIIYLFLFILAILIIFNKNGKNKIANLLLFPTLFMICYCSQTIPDMDNYSLFYDNIGKGYLNSFLGIGWMYLCLVANKIGLSYVLFKSILYLIASILIYLSIGKFVKKRRNIVFGLYLLFPGLLDLVQIRFFLASSIVLYALICMILKMRRKTIVTYLIVVLLASLIHMSCLFYLVFLLIPIFKNFKPKELFVACIFLILIFVLLSNYIDDILIAILPENQASRIANYFDGDYISIFAVAVYGLLFILQFILSYIMYKRIRFNKRLKNVVKCICLINVLILLSFPFVFLSSDFLRLQRPLLLLNYALFIGMSHRIRLPKVKIGDVVIKYKEIFYLSYIMYIVLFIFAFNYQSLFAFLGF